MGGLWHWDWFLWMVWKGVLVVSCFVGQPESAIGANAEDGVSNCPTGGL